MGRTSAKKVMQDAYNEQSETVKNQTMKISELEQKLYNMEMYNNIRNSEGIKNNHYQKDSYFYKGFKTNLINMLSSVELSSSEVKILFYCCPLLEKETNMVMTTKGDRATEKYLLSFLKMTRETFDKAIKELTQKDIMYKIQKSSRLVNFMMNPKYFYVGQDPKMCIQEFYEMQKRTNLVQNDT